MFLLGDSGEGEIDEVGGGGVALRGGMFGNNATKQPNDMSVIG